MAKSLVSTVLAASVILLFLCDVDARTHHVFHPSASPSPTIPSASISTLEAALLAAVPNDIIVVHPHTASFSCGIEATGRIISTANLTIMSSSPTKQVVFDCMHASRAFLIREDASRFTLQGITVQNASTIRLASTLEAHGAALYSTDSALVIRDCNFVNNEATNIALTPVAGGAIGLQRRTGVAPVYLDLLIERSTFTNNSATSGGGAVAVFAPGNSILSSKIFGDMNVSVSIRECTFTGNTMNVPSGAQSGFVAGGGGAVGIWSVVTHRLSYSLVISDTVMRENSNFPIGGGALGLHLPFISEVYSSSLVIENSDISSNLHGGPQFQIDGAGAIFFYVAGASSVIARGLSSQISTTSFTHNTNVATTVAGALGFVFTSGVEEHNITVDRSTVSYNTITGSMENRVNANVVSGGIAVYCETSVNNRVTLSKSQLVGNSVMLTPSPGPTSENFGAGAFAVHNIGLTISSKTSIDDTLISGNKYLAPDCPGGGGAALLFTDDSPLQVPSRVLSHGNVFTVASSQFVNNANLGGALGGGGLGLYDAVGLDSLGSIKISHSEFSGNSISPGSKTATGGGGVGLALASTPLPNTNTVLSIDECSFSQNTASGGGGFAVTKSILSEQTNMVINITGTSFNGNAAVDTSLGGGGLFMEGPTDTAHNVSSKFNDTHLPPPAPGPSVTAKFQDFEYTNRLYIKACAFTNNTASCSKCSGGAVSMRNGYLSISHNTTISGNNAGYTGGGVIFMGTLSLDLSNSYIGNNTAGVPLASQFSSSASGSFVASRSVVQGTQFGSDADSSFLLISDGGQVQTTDSYFACSGPAGVTNVTYRRVKDDNLVQTFNLKCTICPSGQYSTHSGRNQTTPVTSNPCLPCGNLTGVTCTGGDIFTLRGFWALRNGTGPLDGWRTTACAPGFCCPDTTCVLRQQSVCAYGRDPSTPLCGNCLHGYSQALTSGVCVPNTDCTQGDWYWPVYLLVMIGWCFWLGQPPDTSWQAGVLLFLYQNLPLVTIGTATAEQEIALLSLFSMHMPTSTHSSDSASRSDICAVVGLTTAQKLSLPLLGPGIIIMLIIIAGSVAALGGSRGWAVKVKRRVRLAALRAALSLYSSVSSVVMSLLACVTVDGLDSRVLHRAGGVTCTTWWQGLLIAALIVVVVPFPLTLAWFEKRLKLKYSHLPKDDNKWYGVQMLLTGPYSEDKHYGTALVVAKRLALALVASFVVQPAIRAILLSFLIFVFTIHHVATKMFKCQAANRVETVALFVLYFNAVMSVLFGDQESIGYTPPGWIGRLSTNLRTYYIQGYHILVPIVRRCLAHDIFDQSSRCTCRPVP